MSALKNTLCFLACGLIAQPALAQDFYKWIDSKGTTHYTKTAPPKNAKKVESVNTYVSKRDAITQGYNNYYKNKSSSSSYNDGYGQSSQPARNSYQSYSAPQRSASDEAARQEAIKAASTPYKGSQNGQLTANQLRTLAALSGADTSGYADSGSSYSAPMPQRQPSTITNCDGAGCWGSDGIRYNRGAGDTYFPSTGGSCQGIGSQMQCN